jgi:hypothetical protein
MTRRASDPGRSGRGPTLADAVARRLAGTVLEWAITPILAMLTIGIALGLLVAWTVILVVYAQVMIALGITMGTTGSGALVLAIGLILSAAILFVPVRWAVRNLLGAQRRLDRTADRLGLATTIEPGAVGESRPRAAPISATELARLDARMAPPPMAAEPADRPDQPES